MPVACAHNAAPLGRASNAERERERERESERERERERERESVCVCARARACVTSCVRVGERECV